MAVTGARVTVPGLILALLAFPALAAAAPGDARAIQGTLVWVPVASGEPFAVVRTDDGKHFIVDLSAAQRRGPIGGVGERLTIAGAEGARPYEIAATAIVAGDTTLSTLPAGPGVPSASPPTMGAPAAAAAPSLERTWRRFDGKVESVSQAELTLRDAAGATVTIDVSRLSGDVRSVTRQGDDVTVFVTTEESDGRLVAVGFVHTDAATGSALPRGR